MIFYFVMALVAFAVTVFVHELGHFLLARRAGVKVEVFSIGFGPRILTLLKDRYGTEWILAWLPLGGYVKMRGQEDMPGKGGEDLASDSYQSKGPWARLSIVVAGVVFNVVFAYLLLVSAHIVGLPMTDNRIAGPEAGSAARNAGFLMGDEVIGINGTSVESFEDLLTRQSILKPGQMAKVTVRRDGKVVDLEAPVVESREGDSKRGATLGLKPLLSPVLASVPAGSSMEKAGLRKGDVLAYLENREGTTRVHGVEAIVRFVQASGGQTIKVGFVRDGKPGTTLLTVEVIRVPETVVQTTAVIDPLPGSIAEKGGLKKGDVVLSINQKMIRGWEDMVQAITAATPGQPLPFAVKRGKETVTVTVVPERHPSEERVMVGVAPSQIEKGHMAKSITWVSPFMESVSGGLRIGDELVERPAVTSNQVTWKAVRLGRPFTLSLPVSNMPSMAVGSLGDLEIMPKMARYGVVESFVKSAQRVPRELVEVYQVLGKFVTGAFSPEYIYGPVRIFQESARAAEVRGWAFFVFLFAKIGFSLAVMNLLPIPGLDGSHALFIVYEIVTRRKVPEKVQQVAQVVGTVLLLSLIAFVLFNDFTHIFK